MLLLLLCAILCFKVFQVCNSWFLQGEGVNDDAADNYEDRQHAQPEV